MAMARETAHEEPAASGAVQPPKGRGKLVLIIALAVVLLAGGGAAYWFKFLRHPSAEKVSGSTTPEPVESQPASLGVGVFLSLDPFIVNLADATDTKYLKVSMDMEIESAGLKGQVEIRLPQIRDAIIGVLTDKRFEDVRSSEGKERLKREILALTNHLVQRGVVKNIYFTEFVVQ